MLQQKVSVLVFPGSNSHVETHRALSEFFPGSVDYVFCDDAIPASTKLIVIPGGFAYGDYLRAGCVAANMPIMAQVRRMACDGCLVLGICNGMQILMEAGLLGESSMLINEKGFFVSKMARVRVERNDTPFTCMLNKGDILNLPIAHMEGRFYTLNKEQAKQNAVFRYVEQCNGAYDQIAGLASWEYKNVLGMMPHPERACHKVYAGYVGNAGDAGYGIFASISKYLGT